ARGPNPESTAAVRELAEVEEIPLEGTFANEEQLPPLPPPIAAAAGAPAPPGAQGGEKLAKAGGNPEWVWRVGAGGGAPAVLLIGFFVLRAQSAARPSVTRDAALEQEVRESKQALVEGQKLFGEGKYTESLARFRQVLARSPNNQEARKYAQMAENA